jgi:hypothetical protein
VTLSWDDGHLLKLKVAGLLFEFGIKGAFYFVPNNRQSAVLEGDIFKNLVSVSKLAHSMMHSDLKRLNAQDLEIEIRSLKSELKNLISAPIHML